LASLPAIGLPCPQISILSMANLYRNPTLYRVRKVFIIILFDVRITIKSLMLNMNIVKDINYIFRQLRIGEDGGGDVTCP
jgi:hypothetical protein